MITKIGEEAVNWPATLVGGALGAGAGYLAGNGAACLADGLIKLKCYYDIEDLVDRFDKADKTLENKGFTPQKQSIAEDKLFYNKANSLAKLKNKYDSILKWSGIGLKGALTTAGALGAAYWANKLSS